jgi:hypothetical protein
MRAVAVIGLALGISCLPLAAQSTLAFAGKIDSGFSPLTSPNPSPAVNTTPAEFDVSASVAGWPSHVQLYEAATPQGPSAVCTEALPPMLTMRPSAYAFDHLQFNSAAIKGTFSHDNLVRMANQFKPGPPLPNAPSYIPLSSRQKFDLFVRRSHSFDTLSGAISDSLTAQATGAYPSFGGGMAGYGKRLGASVTGAETASFLGSFALPALLHQDPRYFRSQETDISQRLAYAASRVLIGRSDDGRNVINSSLILSQFIQAAISNAYIPYRRETVPGTVENALAGLGSVAEARILMEFWPDIRTFLTRHEPQLVHHWEDKWNSTSIGQWSQQQ